MKLYYGVFKYLTLSNYGTVPPYSTISTEEGIIEYRMIVIHRRGTVPPVFSREGNLHFKTCRSSVMDPDPDSMGSMDPYPEPNLQSGNPDPDPGGQQ
jgi:hypothetical protein